MHRNPLIRCSHPTPLTNRPHSGTKPLKHNYNNKKKVKRQLHEHPKKSKTGGGGGTAQMESQQGPIATARNFTIRPGGVDKKGVSGFDLAPPYQPPPSPGGTGTGGGAAGSTCATRPELLAPPAGRAAHRAQVSAAGCGGDRAPHPARGESAPPAGIKIWHRRRLGTAACTRLPPPPKKKTQTPPKKNKKERRRLDGGTRLSAPGAEEYT